MLLPAVPITVSAETYNDLTYEKYDDHIVITDCKISATSVDIPAEIDGLPVTEIGEYAFYVCDSLTSITIPSSVTSIDMGAFEYCKSLTSVTIPSSVTSIGRFAFDGTAYYNDRSNWQNGVLYIDDCLVGVNRYELPSNYKINDGTRVIANFSFAFRDNLTSVIMPSSVTSIGDGTFSGCGSLNITVDKNNPNYSDIDGVLFNKNKTEIIAYSKDEIQPEYSIPNSVISIDGAFAYCESLTNVKIPDSVTSIGDDAFSVCERLTSVTIPNGVTSIGDSAFEGCNSLISITIGNSVKSIGKRTFSGCNSLTNITIPSSVTSIGYEAFSSCYSLTSVTIPNSVTSIGESAFSGCYSLTSVTIPNSIKSIGKSAFLDCSSLANVIIGNGVISIGDYAFYNCDSLTDVYYSGNEADWQNIIIEYGNDCLTGATIHYNSEGLPRIEVSEPVVEGGSITITAETKSIDGEGELFAVGYDGNKLTASEKLQGGAATLPAEDVQTIKVFCWDSLDTMRPLCEPKTITIK